MAVFDECFKDIAHLLVGYRALLTVEGLILAVCGCDTRTSVRQARHFREGRVSVPF